MQKAIALAEHRQLLLPPRRIFACSSLPKVDAIIFDMDGVLVVSRKAAAAALEKVARQEGRKVSSVQIELALENGNSAASIVESLLPCLCGRPSELDRVARAYTEASLENFGMMEKSAIADALPSLFSRFGLAIATNRTRDAAMGILDRLGMLHFFKSVLTLSDAPKKPSPAMVILAMEALGASRTSSVFVGDKPSDRRAGEDAGVRTIMVDANRGERGCLPFLMEFHK